MQDIQYLKATNSGNLIEHKYGSKINILSGTYLWTLLAKFSNPKTTQPYLNTYLEEIYNLLFSFTLNTFFPHDLQTLETRMKAIVPEGKFTGDQISPNQKVVVVSLARAGILPSYFCYEKLHLTLQAENIRQDHFYAQRKTNEKGEVIGVDISGSKIGGDVDNAIVIIPDPMGATAASICHVIDHYKNKVDGTPLKFICLHAMITPEYVKKITSAHPDAEVVATRLDRGLSTEKALSEIPGSIPAEERGLTDKQYIVPGAGGVGELLNNAYE